MSPPLVRGGVDVTLPQGEHTFGNVYREMMYQVARDYSSVPDVRTLRVSEIRWFYDGLRPELKVHTKLRA